MRARSHAVPILQLFALTVMVIPSDAVIRAIGANGYPAALVGMFAFATFLAATLLGLHDPLRHRHPVRTVVCLLWVAVLASYVLMDRAEHSVIEVAGADRMLMQLAVITGVALVAAECLHSLRDVRRVLRALTWGAAFCGVVAALQFCTCASCPASRSTSTTPASSAAPRSTASPAPRSTRSSSGSRPGCCCRSRSTSRSPTRSGPRAGAGPRSC